MTFRPTALAVTLLLTLTPLVTSAAEVSATYVFETVDSYDIKSQSENHPYLFQVEITGILAGEAEPQTVTLDYSPKISTTSGTDEVSSARTFERCERLILLAMTRPGQYLLEVRKEGTPDPYLLYPRYIGCKLTRR